LEHPTTKEVRSSKRPKKTPVTKKIDFFMVKGKGSIDSSTLLIFHQNICGLKKTDKMINSCSPMLPHILCFSEHHLKQLELEQINLEGYKLGAAYCRKTLLKGGVCIFFS
jgi:hypothetical protein